MRKKKYFYQFILILLFTVNYSTNAQIDRFIEDFRISDEYIGVIKIDPFKDIISKKNVEDIANFSFNWWSKSTWQTAIDNERLLRLAREKSRRDWFDKQKGLIKANIENKLNQSFPNFNEAKDALFLASESTNLFNNRKPPKLKYDNLNSKGYQRNLDYLKELFVLEHRKLEVESGNINSSLFSDFNVRGTDLKDLKSVESINTLWNTIEDQFSQNTATTFIYKDIYKTINNLGAEFNNEIVRLKNNYYYSSDEWQQLNLIQVLLNYEYYKKQSRCWMCFPDNPLFAFDGIDVTTEEAIEEYAINNRKGGYSFFDERTLNDYINEYTSVYSVKYALRFPHIVAQARENAIKEYEKEKQRRLNELLASTLNKIDLVITALGEDNNAFLNARPDLRREVVEYLEVNDLSQYARDGINYLLTQFRTNPEFIVNADLFKATKSSGQIASNPNLALQIGFNQQAITEGITNFGNVLAELFKDNSNPEFEGSLIRVIFAANGYNINPLLANEWFGMGFRFVKNNGESLLIHFENGNRDYGEVKKKWYLDKDKDGYHAKGSSSLVQDFNPGGDWREGVSKGEDCDDNDKTKTTDCKDKQKNCTKRKGFLYDANFKDKKVTLGENITVAEDNFRNGSWELIKETNCGNGKIPKGSIVKVLSTTPKIRKIGSKSLNYYEVEYEDCPKGNNTDNGNFDKNKPCSDCFKGNPVKGDMNLAKQKASGFKGATMGWTRKRLNNLGKLVPKQHKGVDIETKKGNPIYAMFDGTTKLKTNKKNGTVVGGGYYVALTSKVNGKTIETWYFHMQKDTRVSGEVKAGDIIGYQGDSGNLKNAVANKSTPIHVHIQLYENGKLKDPLPYLKAGLDETTGKFTNETDCND